MISVTEPTSVVFVIEFLSQPFFFFSMGKSEVTVGFTSTLTCLLVDLLFLKYFSVISYWSLFTTSGE